MKVEFEISKETKVEILLDWALNDPAGLAQALGSQYRFDLMAAMPINELIEALEDKGFVITQGSVDLVV